MGFADGLKKRCDAAKDKAELVIRKTGYEVFNSLVGMSPADTGRFRGNWSIGFGSPDISTSGNTSPPSGAPILNWDVSNTLYLTNSLPYAKPLEDGHSKQAPYGMVSLTVQAFGDAFDRAIKEVR